MKRFLLAALLALTLTAHAATITGRVVGVADGDTITVLDADKVQHKIRLSGIDAPEKKQAFGNRSKESLSELAFDKTVNVETNLLAIFLFGQHDVGEGQCPASRESCLKDGLRGVQQLRAALKGAAKALPFHIDQCTTIFGVVNALGDITHLVPHLKARFGRCGVLAQVGAMNLQPQALGALAHGKQLGLRKCAQCQAPLVLTVVADTLLTLGKMSSAATPGGQP